MTEATVTNTVPMFEFDESEDTIIPESADRVRIFYPDGFVGWGYRELGSEETVLYKVEKHQPLMITEIGNCSS